MTMTASPLQEINSRLRQAKDARRTAERQVKKLERERARIKAGPREFDPHAQAGAANVELMRGVFAEGKVLTAAEATRRAGAKPGHQVWGIRALLAEGQIEETGRKVGVSKEYRFVKGKKRTRLAPGE